MKVITRKLWAILNKVPNYNILATNFLSLHSSTYSAEFTEENLESLTPGHRTIYKFANVKNANDEISINVDDNKFVFPKEIYGYPIYSTISILPCPAGFTLTTEKPFRCDCNQQLQHLPTVKCHIQDQTMSRSGLIWIDSDGNKTVVTSQQCPLDYCKQEVINVTLDDVDSQCKYNHSGTLFGGCQSASC